MDRVTARKPWPIRSLPPVFWYFRRRRLVAARRLALRLLGSGRREKVRAPWRGEAHARSMSAVIAAGCARRGAEKRKEMQHRMAAERKAAERKATTVPACIYIPEPSQHRPQPFAPQPCAPPPSGRKLRKKTVSFTEENCVADAGRALENLKAVERKVYRTAAERKKEKCVANAEMALEKLKAATTLDELSDALRRGNQLKSYLPELRRALPQAGKRLDEMLTVEEMRPANEEMGIDDYDDSTSSCPKSTRWGCEKLRRAGWSCWRRVWPRRGSASRRA